MDSLFPGVDFNFEHPEEILLTASRNHLVLAGRDRWDHATMRVIFPSGRNEIEVDGVQQDYGTVSAVYTFKICKSNPAVWDQWLDDVEDEIARNLNFHNRHAINRGEMAEEHRQRVSLPPPVDLVGRPQHL